MFTPRSSSRPRVSPYTGTSGSRQLKSASRSLNLFTPSKRAGLTPGVLTPQFSSGNRLQSSQIIEETSHYVVEVFGAPLPVLIMEAFILSERGTEVSVKLDESGWAWLVCGRRLFIWRYNIVAGLKLAATQCRELTLPPSDLAHKADLICILINNESSVPGAVAVSPEGIIRYWPVVAHEGVSIEVSAELHGQECESLINIQPFGCVLSTTTSSLVLVSLSTTGGQSTVTCCPLKSQSVLAGIGRRMSSFIFGSLPSQSSEMKFHSILAADGKKSDTKILYVLTGNNLQKWKLSLQEVDKLELEFDVDKLLRDNLIDKIWNRDHSLISQVKTWLLDMKLTKNGVIILGAGMNLLSSLQVYLVLGVLNLEGNIAPTNFLSFTIFNYHIWYQEENEENLLNYHFLLPDFHQNVAYIYKEKKILCVPVNDCYQDIQEVVFNSQGDRILGAGCCNQKALFFSNNLGILSVKYLTGLPSLDETIPTESLSILEELTANISQAKIDELNSSENNVVRFKAAFLHHCKGNMNQAQAIVNELFPTSSVSSNETGFLDKTVADLGQELIDDYPASDPRWAESVQQATIMASNSLILLHQLEDKIKAHDYFLAFLKHIGLWDQLKTITVRDHLMSTRLLLCEHAEKLTAAMTLRELQNKNPKPVDAAIKMVLKNRGEVLKIDGLNHQDLFYREISRIQDILPALMDYEQEGISTAVSSRDLVTLVTTVNSIIEGMLHEACNYRQTNAQLYQAHTSVKEPEYLPWTASLGNFGIRILLIKQHKVCVEQAIPEADDIQTRGLLFQQLLGIIDLMLDGYKCQLESIRIKDSESSHFFEVLRMYEQDRQNLIMPLLHHEQYTRAASLAEKYCDFGILVQLCELTDNKERLQQYRIQFAKQGFSDFVFKWYLNAGKRGKLMSESFGEPEELGRFLENHDTLSWLHDILSQNYNKVQETLQTLAVNEQDYMTRKKTMLSMSKLAALASNESQETLQQKLDALDDQLDLLLYQESLPIKVLENTGLDLQTMRVLDARELIELYIGDENEQANEYDFKKALDLVNFVSKNDPNADIEALKQHIWCQAILRDSWDYAETDNPLLSKRDTLFFKTVELAFLHGTNLWDVLPDVNCLLQSEELGDLRENKSFIFLVRAGYEHLQRII